MPTINNGDIAITNSTGNTLYVYNFSYGTPAAVQPVLTLSAKQTQTLTMSASALMRLYFSEKQLVNSLEAGVAPDCYNFSNDGDKRYSFAEYTNNVAGNYTVDLSFLDDAFSFPMTIQFDNDATKIWGINDMSQVVTQLQSQSGEAFWQDLIWTGTDNILRIVGPNKTMAYASYDPPPTPQVPQNIVNFNTSFPGNGTQLAPSNWDAWQNSTTEPLGTGWVKALHAASLGPNIFTGAGGINERYGFYLFPKDDLSGVFDGVPTDIHCTITVYAAGKNPTAA